MNRFIVLSEKKWHEEVFFNLKKEFSEAKWIHICKKEDFNYENLLSINPVKIFIPHWSYIIPSEIYDNFDCIVFHMTDLPYGRGGSPLQNLIVRGHKSTKISALKVQKGIDTGDIYIKDDLSLIGTAQDIFKRSSDVVYVMIEKIIKNNIIPIPQVGEVVEFKRRKPEESNLEFLESLENVFDYIRMLDADGYPNAFLETEFLKFEFFNAELDNKQKSIEAHVRISKK
ncbi:methionyl-tRNA formyltransferase [Flavobacterium sp. TAB 87]|uniref:methionyl-tRNA formyltransferase n=1 Tax=Flavobacterium sp. TAB 87 TaxID=1729581 RepID=UPI00076D5B4D|nr:methionyl-tRNA formyltransferase [Flavobacterium sp. TAB 87]KVV13961.1 Methionyl-tRNA formyltransferase [Flavobacterium sp. TAB 87]